MPLESDLKDQHVERWTFDHDVAREFDSMLDRSVPGYVEMRHLVDRIALRRYIRTPKTWIVDLGCARGSGLVELVKTLGAQAAFTACDVSSPMLEATRKRFEGFIDAGVIEVLKLDLRSEYPQRPASVTLAILTLQFVPIEYRQQVLQNMCDATVPRGCAIVVEKVLGSDAQVDKLLVDEHHDVKRAAGYSNDEILRKRLSLEGVLVPMTARQNEDAIRAAGFAHVDCFWRDLNFAGWVAIKR